LIPNTRRTYALNAWTVEKRDKGWFYWNTYGQDRKDAKGPYSSVFSVCLMVARQLVREVNKRDAPFALPE
jgi:hypothetical protein